MSTALTVMLIMGILAFVLLDILLSKKNRALNLFSPVAFFGMFYILMYVIKPLYSLGVGWYGPGTQEFYKFLIDYEEFSLSLMVVLIGYMSYVFGRHVWVPRCVYSWCPDKIEQIKFVKYYSLFLISISFVTGVSLIYLAGSVLSLLKEIESRHSFFEDKGYLFFLLTIGNVGFMMIFVMWIYKKIGFFVMFAAAIVTILCDFFTGTRAWLLFGMILPCACIWNYTVKQVRVLKFFIVFSVIIVMFVSVRVLTRDIYLKENAGKDEVMLLEEKFLDLANYMLGNLELAQFDTLVVQIDRLSKSGDFTMGQSLVRLAVSPIPKVLIPDFKSDRGNVEYTKRYFPAFFATGGAAMTATYLGDWYMNFWVPGVLIGMFILGWLINASAKFLTRGPLGIVLYSFLIVQMVMILRVDIQQIFSVASIVFVFAAGFIVNNKLKKVNKNNA